jgi:hypothetical protein
MCTVLEIVYITYSVIYCHICIYIIVKNFSVIVQR